MKDCEDLEMILPVGRRCPYIPRLEGFPNDATRDGPRSSSSPISPFLTSKLLTLHKYRYIYIQWYISKLQEVGDLGTL